MFFIYTTKVQRIYQIRKFLGNYFIKNESFFAFLEVFEPANLANSKA